MRVDGAESITRAPSGPNDVQRFNGQPGRGKVPYSEDVTRSTQTLRPALAISTYSLPGSNDSFNPLWDL